jgi:nitroreductase
VRNYQQRNLDPALIDKLLEVAWHAPSGHNDRGVLYTVLDDMAGVAKVREAAIAGLEQLIAASELPEGMEMFVDIIEAWKATGKDILFRGAPHLVIASASRDSAAPLEDCLIGLSTFELYAQSHGVGTIWNGLATLTIAELVPSLRTLLQLPEDHQIGYAMGFGYPAIRYRRTVDRGTPRVAKLLL